MPNCGHVVASKLLVTSKADDPLLKHIGGLQKHVITVRDNPVSAHHSLGRREIKFSAIESHTGKATTWPIAGKLIEQYWTNITKGAEFDFYIRKIVNQSPVRTSEDY